MRGSKTLCHKYTKCVNVDLFGFEALCQGDIRISEGCSCLVNASMLVFFNKILQQCAFVPQLCYFIQKSWFDSGTNLIFSSFFNIIFVFLNV